MSRLTIIESIQHSQLFGALPKFQELKSWETWLILLKAIEGLPLNRHERGVFRKHTGREYDPPPGGYTEIVIIVGVQSGKSSIAGVLLGHGVLTGEPGTVAIGVCQDQRGAMRVLLRYAREPFETLDVFRAEVSRSTADALELNRGTMLAAYPCRPEALRGLRASIVVIDELAFFTATDGRPMDREMLRVARGRLATTGGKLIVISSPYGQSGALYDLHRNNYGKDDALVLVWQASAPEMNPTLPANYLARMAQDDPEAYRSEVLGEFRSGVSTFFDVEALQVCVEESVRERAPQTGTKYLGFADPSGGRHDRFCVAVAHTDGDKAVLDAVRIFAPPFNPSEVIAEACAFLKSYRVHRISGDRYSAEYNAEQFRLNGVTYDPSERDRSGIYLELLPLVNSRRAVLLDHPDLLRELRGLERRRGTSGKDKVDHRPGSTDDIANACAGALVLAGGRRREPGVFVF